MNLNERMKNLRPLRNMETPSVNCGDGGDSVRQKKDGSAKYARLISHFSRIHDSLADEYSRETFAGVVKARMTGDCSFLRQAPFHQYLHPAFPIFSGGVIIDGGISAGNLMEIDAFSAAVGENGKVVGFEPIPELFECARRQLADYPNIVLRPYGLWDSTATVNFSSNHESSHAMTRRRKPIRNALKNASSGIAKLFGFRPNKYGLVCQMTTIDAEMKLADGVIDLIKLDIEGAELRALHGAEGTIRKLRPCLAICIYHNKRDLFEIQDYIASLSLGYEFHIGHHSANTWETVLYAVVPGKKREVKK